MVEAGSENSWYLTKIWIIILYKIWIIYPLQSFHCIWVKNNFIKETLGEYHCKRLGSFVSHEKNHHWKSRVLLLEIKCQEHDIGSEDMRILASLRTQFLDNRSCWRRPLPLNQSWHQRFPAKRSWNLRSNFNLIHYLLLLIINHDVFKCWPFCSCLLILVHV